ncbi:MAG: SDR family oxidoreductase [Dehalococcoidia bacterium]
MSVVLITGCSSGIGKVTALEFARRGDTVFATMRDLSKGAALHGEAAGAGLDVGLLALDVTDDASVRVAVETVIERAGRIDVLVNNAGMGAHGAVEEFADEEVLRAFDANVFGVVRLVRAVAPHMRGQRSGTIINISSIAGRVATAFGGIYAGAKHALEGLSDALYYELHPFGVRVIVVEPGAFATQFSSNRLLARGSGAGSPYAALDRQFGQAMGRRPGSGQSADPQVVATLIADIATAEGPERRYLVGQDAQLIGTLHKQASDADFERALRTALDFWD